MPAIRPGDDKGERAQKPCRHKRNNNSNKAGQPGGGGTVWAAWVGYTAVQSFYISTTNTQSARTCVCVCAFVLMSKWGSSSISSALSSSFVVYIYARANNNKGMCGIRGVIRQAAWLSCRNFRFNLINSANCGLADQITFLIIAIKKNKKSKKTNKVIKIIKIIKKIIIKK